jgi:hypothetical protein
MDLHATDKPMRIMMIHAIESPIPAIGRGGAAAGIRRAELPRCRGYTVAYIAGANWMPSANTHRTRMLRSDRP